MHAITRVNKQGQALGRKGGETRRRLMDATLKLIATEDSHKLSASRIARKAGLASQSFYLYFSSIDEILLVLSEEASADFHMITHVVDTAPTDIRPEDLSCRLVEAFSTHWNRHRAILNVRNYLADCGNPPFLKLRYATSMPLILSLARRIIAAQPAGSMTESSAQGRAIIIFQAMERSAARAESQQYSDSGASQRLNEAAIDVLALLLTPAPR